MKSIVRSLVWGAAVAVLGSSSALAYRHGNPGTVLSHGKASIGFALDLGERELDAGFGGTGDADITGLSIDGKYGLGNGLELRGRLIPMTLSWDFDGSSFSPKIFGVGAGLQWKPGEQKGPLTWGLGFGIDYGQGDDDGVDLDYFDFVFNGGVGYAVDKRMDVYGGLSFIQSDVTVKGSSGKTDLDIDNPMGLFGGVDFKADKNWVIGAELRLVNETMISLTARYVF